MFVPQDGFDSTRWTTLMVGRVLVRHWGFSLVAFRFWET